MPTPGMRTQFTWRDGERTIVFGRGVLDGAVEASLGMKETNELAVMCDTFRPLRLTTLARELDDPSYALSWSGPRETAVR